MVGAAPSVRSMPLDDELSIFDSATGSAFALNRTAADVFALADGHTSVGEIVEILATVYAAEPADLAPDVERVVTQLTGAGLLVPTDHHAS